MIAGIIFDAHKIEKAFADLGCKRVPDAVFEGKTQRHCIWETEWGHRFMAPDSGCGHWVIQEIIDVEIEGTRPGKKSA